MPVEAVATGGDPPGGFAYAYKPSLLGAPWEFKLTAAGMDWSASGRSGHVPFRDVQRISMTFKPASMQTHRFVTEIWSKNAPKLTIVSSSWKGLVEQERLDRFYTTFIAELHRRLAQAGVPVQCTQGRNPLVYWPGLVVFVIVAVALFAMTVHALQVGMFVAALFTGAFFLFFLWQSGNYFRRNRPGVYRVDTPPPDLMPKI